MVFDICGHQNRLDSSAFVATEHWDQTGMTSTQDTTIVVTGAKGFIGRHVAKAFADRGFRVVGIGHGSWPERECREWGLIDWLNGDVTAANLDVLCQRHGPPAHVLHFAGGSSVGVSNATPAEDFARTVDSTVAVAEWIRVRSPNTSAILSSSAAVYGAGHREPIAETASCQPTSPYGHHKRMAELVFESYATTYGLRLFTVRIFSAYGPELKKQLLWDLCVRLSDSPREIELGGSGDEKRDFVHVADVSRLFVLLTTRGIAGPGVVNCGTGVPLTVRDIASRVVSAWGGDVSLGFSNRSRAGDPAYLVSDVDGLQRLPFTSEISWQTGLDEYVQWFKSLRREPPGSIAGS